MNKNTISKWFSMFVLMMVAGITGATAQSLTVADFSIEQGQSKEVAINWNASLVAFLCWIDALGEN